MVFVFMFTLTGCELVAAWTGAGETAESAAEAARVTAEQTTSTLHALEHVLLFIPVYLAGLGTRPLWGKVKGVRDKRRLKAAAK